MGGGELTVCERSCEQVVDEDGVVGHESPAERSPVGVGLDGHDPVAAQERQQRAEQRCDRGLTDPSLGGDDGDRRAPLQTQPQDQLIQAVLVLGAPPRLAHPRQRGDARGAGERRWAGDPRYHRLTRLASRRPARQRPHGKPVPSQAGELLGQRAGGPFAQRAFGVGGARRGRRKCGAWGTSGLCASVRRVGIVGRLHRHRRFTALGTIGAR